MIASQILLEQKSGEMRVSRFQRRFFLSRLPEQPTWFSPDLKQQLFASASAGEEREKPKEESSKADTLAAGNGAEL